MKSLRVVIVDDEAPARERLEDLVMGTTDVELVGSFGDAGRAAEHIDASRVDIVLLDIEMPEMDGLTLAERVQASTAPPVFIFVTAHRDHALRAFELEAVDYLLKPFDDERFHEAVRRAQERVRLRRVAELGGELAQLFPEGERTERDDGPGRADGWADTHLRRLVVEKGDRLLVIPVDRIDYIRGRGPYQALYVTGERYLVRMGLHVLEAKLDPTQFCRIHRSTIVRLDRITALQPHARGDYVVRLADGTRLKLSRSRRDELMRRLGGQ